MNLKSDFYSIGGFSLFEVLVAVVLIAIVFTGVLQMHGSSMRMERHAAFYLKAPELARSKMTELTLDTGDLAGGSGDFGESFPGYLWKAEVEDVDSYELGEFSERIKRMDLTVTLDDELRYDLRKYVFTR